MNFLKSNELGTDSYINSQVYGGLTTQGEGIDLRLEMNNLLYGNSYRKPKGHWIVLRQFDYSKPSEHYNPATKEGIDGPAYIYTDSVIRTRRVPLTYNEMMMKAGMAVNDKFIYYFEYTVKPKRGDYIIELSIDDHTNRPTITQNIMSERLKIVGVQPYRMENGNVQYYAANAETDEVSS